MEWCMPTLQCKKKAYTSIIIVWCASHTGILATVLWLRAHNWVSIHHRVSKHTDAIEVAYLSGPTWYKASSRSVSFCGRTILSSIALADLPQYWAIHCHIYSENTHTYTKTHTHITCVHTWHSYAILHTSHNTFSRKWRTTWHNLQSQEMGS